MNRLQLAVLSLACLFAAGTAAAAELAGNVLLAVGQVSDLGADGRQRLLHDGDTVYAGDSLSTGAGSYADLEFADGGRILLHPDTAFQIERFHYQPAAHPENAPPTAAAEHESAFFRLIRGGLRAISGLIGHVYRNSYRLDTPVATIGIRGTEYEARYCAGNCQDTQGASENGLYAGVERGAIALSNQTGEVITTAGEFLYVRDARSPIRLLKGRPAALHHMRLPERFRRLELQRLKRHPRLNPRQRLLLRQELRHRLRRHGG